jgi:hypothetical protein
MIMNYCAYNISVDLKNISIDYASIHQTSDPADKPFWKKTADFALRFLSGVLGRAVFAAPFALFTERKNFVIETAASCAIESIFAACVTSHPLQSFHIGLAAGAARWWYTNLKIQYGR